MRCVVLIFIIFFIPAMTFSATLYVPDDYSTIQEAIDAAVHGDTVIVKPGTYMENIEFKGKAITVKSEQGPMATVIDGSRNGSVVHINPAYKAMILDGFTIMNGSGTWEGSSGGWVGCGGGIYCEGYGDGPQIRNNIIRDNLIEDYDPFFYNYSRGAGVFCRKCAAVLVNNLFYNNAAFTSNIDSGGGIYFWESASMLVNNTFCCNQSEYGGAMMCLLTSSPTVLNSIFWNNSAQQGPEIHVGYGGTNPSTLTIDYSDVKGGKASVYVQLGSTLNWGSAMIAADPFFVDSPNDDFHLTYPSPCKDTGIYSAILEHHDFEGDPRVAYGAVDMGADEFYTHLYYTGDPAPGGNVELIFVGLPDTSPVAWCIGSGVLEPPILSMWGDWYLQFPIIGPIDMGKIPSPNGVLIFTGILPGVPPPPYSIPIQALIGDALTNLCVLEVE